MAKKKIRKLNKWKIISLIVVVLSIIALASYLLFFHNNKSGNDDNGSTVIDSVNNYKLDDNKTTYYKNLFAKLKEELKKEEVNEETYATLITQLFVSDFFTLDNKVSSSDIGGTQFVYESYQDDFESSAKTTIYNHVESNIYGDRDQDLPIVHSVDVISIDKISYDYLDLTDDDAYEIEVQITYEKDMGYQDKAILTLVHNNDLLEIVKMSEE
ncbi:MAG: hypothetical protein PHE54_05530 [Bacilli bacterium]|nr:hypothetical protein [Bacilli bacterium]